MDLQGITTNIRVITAPSAWQCLLVASTSVSSTASRDTTRRQRRYRIRLPRLQHRRSGPRLFRLRSCPGRRPPSPLSTPQRTYRPRINKPPWRRRSISRHTTSTIRRLRQVTCRDQPGAVSHEEGYASWRGVQLSSLGFSPPDFIPPSVLLYTTFACGEFLAYIDASDAPYDYSTGPPIQKYPVYT